MQQHITWILRVVLAGLMILFLSQPVWRINITIGQVSKLLEKEFPSGESVNESQVIAFLKSRNLQYWVGYKEESRLATALVITPNAKPSERDVHAIIYDSKQNSSKRWNIEIDFYIREEGELAGWNVSEVENGPNGG